ncbi:MAG: 4'-phosphopantetheinyl transferase superfamily protein [Spirochaetales bacterium]|nr:4'-phosphopantetheinyl transferase superfamily protein [Spirochaetales bacterium]
MDLEVFTSPHVPRLHWTRIPQPLPDGLAREGRAVLDEEEKARHGRFRHQRSADMYLGARLFGKTLLGNILGVAPEHVRFSYEEGGKPFLKEYPHLYFNLSHSAGVAAFISSEEGECGVDVEEIKDRDCLNLARHFFSQDEIEALEEANNQGKSSDKMVELFFEIWTQKEAYLKGTGKGLPGGLKHYTVPRVSGEQGLGEFTIENFRPYPKIMGAYALPS